MSAVEPETPAVEADHAEGANPPRPKSRVPSAGDLWLPLNDLWAVGEDDQQWILFQRTRKANGAFGNWRARRFHVDREPLVEVSLRPLVFGDQQQHAALEVIATWPARHSDNRPRK